MKATLTKTLIASFAIVMAIGNLNAEEEVQYEEETVNTEENVVVNSRPLSEEQKKLLEEQRQAELEELDEMLESESTELSGLIIPIKTQNLIALASNELHTTATTYSPFAYHWIESFPQGNILKLQDGSEWLIHKDDAEVFYTWRTNSTVVLTPASSWFTTPKHPYILHNKELDQSIRVKLFLGPIQYGPLSTWVAEIDRNANEVFLINGQGDRTIWEVHPSDTYLLNGSNLEEGWLVNDTVIVGKNDGWLWWFSSYDHILINIEANHHIRVRPVSSIPNSYSSIGGQ